MSELHTVSVEPSTLIEMPTEKFSCAGTRESECHIYPDAEEWDEEDGQGRTAHEECWLQGWFDNDSYAYYGADALNDGGVMGVPNTARSGEIEFEYEAGCGPTWWWKGVRDDG